VQAIDFNIKNFKKMRNNIYNLGLSSANLTKLQLANKIKKVTKSKCIISASSKKKDPDQRDYFVSNKKIEKMGFKAKYSLESGIKELQNVYKNLNRKVVNNY
jgi:nucleoside-diphosphate-sugar epimerase